MGTYNRKSLMCILLCMLLLFVSGCRGASQVQSQEAEETVEEENTQEQGSTAKGGDTTTSTQEATKTEEISIDIEPEEETEIEEGLDSSTETEEVQTSDPKDVDLIFFMGQSNMSGCGGDASLAPSVISGAGYEFRAVTDPFSLHEIVEPFGLNESIPGAIWDVPGAKKGSLVSAFVNEYYQETGRVVVAVSASAGATTTDYWMSPSFTTDLSLRMKNAQDYLAQNGYTVGNQYVVWLQGESDALDKTTSDEYKTNMDNIIRPLFIGGFSKVFIITPGQINTNSNFFNDIINAQIEMCKTSGYYALATTALCAVNTSYMVDEWHYNQKVLNLIGTEAAKSVAYYTNNDKEMCIYDYKHGQTYIPDYFDYPEDTEVEQKDINGILAQQ